MTRGTLRQKDAVVLLEEKVGVIPLLMAEATLRQPLKSGIPFTDPPYGYPRTRVHV
jgi:hypothetical protein